MPIFAYILALFLLIAIVSYVGSSFSKPGTVYLTTLLSLSLFCIVGYDRYEAAAVSNFGYFLVGIGILYSVFIGYKLLLSSDKAPLTQIHLPSWQMALFTIAMGVALLICFKSDLLTSNAFLAISTVLILSVMAVWGIASAPVAVAVTVNSLPLIALLAVMELYPLPSWPASEQAIPTEGLLTTLAIIGCPVFYWFNEVTRRLRAAEASQA